MTHSPSLASLLELARNAGAHAADRRYGVKIASYIPGMTTPDEDEAMARAEHLVPMPMTGPLAHRGYAEMPDSPGAMPTPPPPANGADYTPEERSLIMRVALSRMGNVMRGRVDRDTLAAGGHLRVASAPWTEPRLASPASGDERGGPNSGTSTEYNTDYRGGVDGFGRADIGAGLTPDPRIAIADAQASKKPIETYTADVFAQLAQRESAARDARRAAGPDPLADTREKQRQWGHSSSTDNMWGPAISTMASDPSASPLGVNGVRP